MTRKREAPSAARIAISLLRPAALANSRFATLAQAINSTNITAPNNRAIVYDASLWANVAQLLERAPRESDLRFHGVDLGTHCAHTGLHTLDSLIDVVQAFGEPGSSLLISRVALRTSCHNIYRSDRLSQWSPHFPYDTAQ